LILCRGLTLRCRSLTVGLLVGIVAAIVLELAAGIVVGKMFRECWEVVVDCTVGFGLVSVAVHSRYVAEDIIDFEGYTVADISCFEVDIVVDLRYSPVDIVVVNYFRAIAAGLVIAEYVVDYFP